ncbi:hypothetical protein KEM52_000542 [Ascosphaera acerosa]|nr:hypothetical protein KEM52_000542 [Ascosphaera acerosa]
MQLLNWTRAAAAAGLCLAVAVAGVGAADAPITKDNTGTAVYAAELLDKANTTIRGVISGQGGPHGKGIKIHLRFTGLPNNDSMAPYMYHIHQYRVPEDGNCYATGGHLSPYGVPDDFKCDPQFAQRCQVGDLSGKHGKLPKGDYITMYRDDYLSINTMDPAFFGNLSIVVHSNDNTRLNCGNFVKVAGNEIAAPVSNLPNVTATATTTTTSANAGYSASNTAGTVTPWYTGMKPLQTGDFKSGKKYSTETTKSKTYHTPSPTGHSEDDEKAYTNGGATAVVPCDLLAALFVLFTSFFLAQ